MSIDAPTGLKTARAIVNYMLQQEGRVNETKLIAYADTYHAIDSETIGKMVDYLMREGLLTGTPDLDGEMWFQPDPHMSIKLPGAVENQLTVWCSPDIDDNTGLPVPRGRGAPVGNTNAMKHGKYSLALKQVYGVNIQDHHLDLMDELDTARAQMADLLEDPQPLPLELYIKLSSHIAKLVIAQIAINPEGRKDDYKLPPSAEQSDS